MPQDEKRRLHGLAQADALSGAELFHWNRPAFSPNHSLLVRPHQLLCESFRPLKTSPDITEKRTSTERPRATECYAGPQMREETVSRYISRCHKSRYRWKRASSKLQMTMMETADMAHSLVVTGLRDSFLDVFFVYAFSDVRSKREMLEAFDNQKQSMPSPSPTRTGRNRDHVSRGGENACAGLR